MSKEQLIIVNLSGRGDKDVAQAAEHLRLTSADLLGFGIVDRVVKEPLGGAHRDSAAFVEIVLDTIEAELRSLEDFDGPALRERRYAKYRRIGAWERATLTRVATALT